MGNQFKRVKRCAFCENRPDSGEHLWADWAIHRFRGVDDRISGETQGVPYRADPLQKAMGDEDRDGF